MIDQIVNLVKHSNRITPAFRECFSEQMIALLAVGLGFALLTILLIHEHKKQKMQFAATHRYRSGKH